MNVTGSHVASEMDIDLTVREVTVSGDLDVRKFASGEGDRAGFEAVRIEVDVETDEDEETVATWLSAMETHNPVLDTFARPTPVEVTLSR